MLKQMSTLKHISFDKYKKGQKYGPFDVKRDFGTWLSWGTVWPYRRAKIIHKSGNKKALRIKYPKNKIRFFCSGACWHCKNFGKHKDLYLSYWIKFSSSFEFKQGGKLHGLCGGAGNTGGNKPNGHDGWSCRVHWGPGPKIKQYIYHKDQPHPRYGHVLFWTHNPELLVIEPNSKINRNKDQEVEIERDKWHNILTRVVVNDIGQKNGMVQSWYDDELVLNARGFEFRDSSCTENELLCDNFYFCTFFGGSSAPYKPSKNEYADFADFKILKKKA